MRDLHGRCAVVTGGGNGIGAALAARLIAEGMNVIVADVAIDDAESVAASWGADRAFAVRCDVSKEDQVEALAQSAEERFGPVALLCNNAGIVPGGRDRKVWEYTLNDWRWSFGVNLYGVVNGIRSFVPRMIAHGAPAHVLNTASIAGFVSGSGSACYGASKHAVVRVTEALYAGLREIEAPVGVTLLAPGLVQTRIYEAERIRPPEFADSQGKPHESDQLQALRADLLRRAASAEDVAAMAIDAVREDRFYAITTDAFDSAIAQRNEDILGRAQPHFETIAAMSRKQSARPSTGDTQT